MYDEVDPSFPARIVVAAVLADADCKFLHEAEVDECHLTRSFVELRGYVSGIFS